MQKFNPEEIYERLEDLKSAKEYGDSARYRKIMKVLPSIISIEELIDYHEFLIEPRDELEERVEELIGELEDQVDRDEYGHYIANYILDEFRDKITPDAFSKLERVINDALLFYKIKKSNGA